MPATQTFNAPGLQVQHRERSKDSSLLQRQLRKGMRLGRAMLDQLGQSMAEHSLCGDQPVFDVSAFPWVHELEAGFADVRQELDAVLAQRERIPNFQDVSPDQAHLTRGDDWKTYFLYAYGYAAERNCAACPGTAELVRRIPGMKTAFFSILAPGSHVPAHRGPYKGLLRCHLGLKVPDPELCRLRVADQMLHWEEGRCMVFDDTYEHEVWNDSDEDRVVLFLDIMRPMAPLWSASNELLISAVSMSPLVQDGLARFRELEEAAQEAPSEDDYDMGQ